MIQLVATLTLPDTVSLRRRHRARLLADLRSASGTHLANQHVEWGSIDPSIVTVDTSGLLLPQSVGTGRVTAQAIGFADTAVVVVQPESVYYVTRPIGDDDRLGVGRPETWEVVPLDSAARPAEGAVVAWRSTDTMVATIEPVAGNSWQAIVTPIGRGPVWLVASSGAGRDSVFQESEFPIVHWRFAAETLFVPHRATRPLLAVGTDSLGTGLGVAAGVTPFPIDSGIVVASGGPGFWSLFGLQVGSARVVGIVYDLYPVEDTAIVVVVPAGQDRMTWQEQTHSAVNFSSFDASLVITDSAGAPATVPRLVTLSSSDTAVLRITQQEFYGVTSGLTVHAQARRRGSAVLTAKMDSTETSLAIVVSERRPYRLTLSPQLPIVNESDSIAITATAVGGDLVPYDYPLTWASSDSSIASVSPTGIVHGLSSGVVTISAFAQAIGDSVRVVVRSLAAPVVTSIGPEPVFPGAVTQIRGTGFDPDVAENRVMVEGRSVAVVTATDTLLELLFPGPGSFTCDTIHNTPLVVSSRGRFTVASVRLAPAAPVALVGPEAVSVSPLIAQCMRVTQPTSISVLLSIVNASADPADKADLRIRTLTVPPDQSPPGPQAPASIVPGVATSVPERAVNRDSLRDWASRHYRILNGNRDLITRAGAPVPLLQAARQARPQRSVSARVGNLVMIRVPRVDYPDFCSRYTTITARLVYSGAHTLVFEDTAAPLRGTMDDVFQSVGAEFDTSMWGILQANFGNPVALDSLLDRNNRVAMVFSPAVNAFGVAGFVTSCDFYPESVAPSSNTGELFYAQVPTAPGSGFTTYTRDAWRWLMRSVVMHETKHLTTLSERFARGAPPEETWLEEGTAVIAEELWARGIYHTVWKGNAQYNGTLFCDVRPTTPACAGRPYAMFNAFALLYDFALKHAERTPLGPSIPGDGSFYGSGWSLIRWTIDRYATSESTFLTSLTQDPTAAGVLNLERRAGHQFSEFVEDWALALRTDELQPTVLPQMPGWDLPSIFAGMSSDFPADFPSPQPVAEQDPFSSEYVNPIPGSGFVLRTTTPVLNQLIQVTHPLAGPVSDRLRIRIMSRP